VIESSFTYAVHHKTNFEWHTTCNLLGTCALTRLLFQKGEPVILIALSFLVSIQPKSGECRGPETEEPLAIIEEARLSQVRGEQILDKETQKLVSDCVGSTSPVSKKACKELRRNASKVVPQLIDSLELSASTQSRTEAAIALRKLGTREPSAVLALTKALKSSDPILRRQAIKTLSSMSEVASPALATLEEIAQTDADAKVRRNAQNLVEKINSSQSVGVTSTFSGQVKLLSSCDGSDHSPYRVTLRTRVVGDSIELEILEFVSEANNTPGTVGARFQGVQAVGQLSNETDFFAENPDDTERHISVTGALARGREAISSLQVAISVKNLSGFLCKDEFTNVGLEPLRLIVKDR
jgi:hypothetical protein